MVTENNEIKLVDMGIARKFLWDSRVSCGTAGYIAPEILWEQKANDRADIYSLGVVFYQMISA